MKNVVLGIILKLVESLITDEMIKAVKTQFINYLRQLADRTENELDDKIVEIVARALEVAE